MLYKFPVIENLKQVQEAISGRDEFIVAERDWGYVVNYLVNLVDTFPYPDTKDEALNERYKLRRECRGLKFDLNGDPLARPYHKFHNFGERPETMAQNVDFSKKFILLNKLDGSMIHPIMFEDKVRVCTKMGLTDIATPVQGFVERGLSFIDGDKKRVWYMDFMFDLMKSNLTPIFEWCSRKQRIVVDYGEHDHLILTAVRDLYTGEYKSYDQLVALAEPYGVPVVDRWEGTFEGITEFLNEVQGREGEEGCVLRWPGGHMMKFKNLWYCQLHKTKELLTFEKDVWALVIDEKHDDAKAFMEQEDKDRIDAFADDLFKALNDTADRLWWEVTAWVDNKGDSQKKFAVNFVNNADNKFTSHERQLLFKIKDDLDNSRQLVYDCVRKSLGSGTKLEEVRHLAGGIIWGSY